MSVLGYGEGPHDRASAASPYPSAVVPTRTVAHYLDVRHYLGATGRGFAWSDEFGVLVLAKPTARYLPQDGTWLELVRWCLEGIPNGGSQQWSRVTRFLRRNKPEVTTVVSYSDPSAGHTGALYKACNWVWAPTWHRLRPPPTGNGAWRAGEQQSVKDRWVFMLRDDVRREELLRVKDDALDRGDAVCLETPVSSRSSAPLSQVVRARAGVPPRVSLPGTPAAPTFPRENA